MNNIVFTSPINNDVQLDIHQKTIIMEWVSIGANSIIQNDLEIGKRVTVAPGSTVTHSISPY